MLHYRCLLVYVRLQYNIMHPTILFGNITVSVEKYKTYAYICMWASLLKPLLKGVELYEYR